MPAGISRLFFFTLVSLFVLQTYFVYTSGTKENAGNAFITEDSKAGKLLFQEFNCVACHQLYGLGGYMGPDLTNVFSAPGKGPAYAEVFLRNGTNRMPNFKMNEDQIRQLLAYLEYVDHTGISPLREYELNRDGSISLPADQ